MGIDIQIEQTPNHPLILRIGLRRLGLEEVDALLAQGDGDLHIFPPNRQLRGRRKEVPDDLRLADRLIAVSYFPAHR